MNFRLRQLLFNAYYVGTGRKRILQDVDKLEATLHAPRAEIEALSRRRLVEILQHASATVPFYRNLIGGQRITPDRAFDVLYALPIMSKAMIRDNGSKLHSDRPGPKPRTNTSGGSTGEPIRLLQDRAMGQESRSGELLYLRWAGHRPGDPHLRIWGVPKVTFINGPGLSFRERVYRFVCNETYLNCYGISDQLLDQWIGTLQRLKPTVIESYVDAAFELSRRILSTRADVPKPRGLIVSAGVLTPHARATIAKAFGAPILNRYGSREVGNVACSCGASDLLHVNEGWCHLEIVDESGKECPPGVEGDVLVTLFGNKTMPLIRYRIEDRATWAAGSCPCGRNTKMLAAINGRTNDYLMARDGSRISGVALTTLLYGVDGIRQFQYRQTEPGNVILAVVPLEPDRASDLVEHLREPTANLEQLLRGGRVSISVEDEITPSNSGKFRYVLNELPQPSS